MKKKNGKPPVKKASSLITKDKGFVIPDKGKWITVSTWNGKGKYGYTNSYIPNTAENRNQIVKLKGQPVDCDTFRGKKRWIFQ